MVFNTFVWMQILNQYNNRRIDNKLNIFEGITRNWLFIGINLSMIVGQVIIILIGGRALQVVRLNGAQWGYSIVLGFLSIPVAVITRLIPDDVFQKIIPHRWQPQVTTSAPVVSDESQLKDWNSALLEIREELEILSWIHGGRLQECNRRNKSHRKSSLKPVAVMAGLVAGSIGGVEMLTFRNEKQRLHYLRIISSGPIILQDPGNISGTFTSDLESLEKEMKLQAHVTPKATATALAHRRAHAHLKSFVDFKAHFAFCGFNCDYVSVADSTVAQIPRPVAIYAQQRSAGHHPVIPAVNNTSIFCCKVPPR
ncbi:hypothetical protein V502_03144, partial [Pseudogymnoascus sp. VKM F-4520 (FW-2644)]